VLAGLWLLSLIGFAAGSLPAQAQIFDPAFQNRQFDSAVAALKRGDDTLALEGFEAQAEQGDLAAQYNAGWMRAKGLGAPVDFIAAYQWFALVAQAGQEKGINALHELRRHMRPDDIAEGERRAEAWRGRRQAAVP
jgi:localization factor PodJL